jgi:hypothetical protein
MRHAARLVAYSSSLTTALSTDSQNLTTSGVCPPLRLELQPDSAFVSEMRLGDFHVAILP